MPLPDPKEVVISFQTEWGQLLNAKEPLTAKQQREMAMRMGDVLNYLSATTSEPSLLNHMYSQSAHDARVKEQLNAERNQLEMHRKFIESSFEKVDQYLRTIQLAGYAAFFGLWSLSKTYLPETHALVALILMVISASVFMVWEVAKSSILAITIQRHSKLALGTLETFMSARGQVKDKTSAIYVVSRFRPVPWFLSVTTAVSSLGVLLWSLATSFITGA